MCRERSLVYVVTNVPCRSFIGKSREVPAGRLHTQFVGSQRDQYPDIGQFVSDHESIENVANRNGLHIRFLWVDVRNPLRSGPSRLLTETFRLRMNGVSTAI